MRVSLSIIIPVYNVEKYVKCAIDSAINQQLNNYEIIIVNDGSTDNSYNIIKQYKNIPNIIIINQKNLGLSAARNAGLKVAKGEYIVYLDSDDYLNVNSLVEIYKKISSENADLAVFSGTRFLDGTNEKEHYGIDIKKSFDTGIEAYIELQNKKQYFTGVYYQIIKKRVLLENNISFIEGIIHEDHYYTFAVFMKSNKTMLIPNEVYNYRIRNNSIMTGSINNMKRFIGFSISYHYMNALISDIIVKIRKEQRKVINKHLTNIKWIAIKYLLRISKTDKQMKRRIKGCCCYLLDERANYLNVVIRSKLKVLNIGGKYNENK